MLLRKILAGCLTGCLALALMPVAAQAQATLCHAYIEAGDRAAAENDYDKAEKLYGSALKEAHEANNQQCTATALERVGICLMRRGKCDEAETAWKTCLSIAETQPSSGELIDELLSRLAAVKFYQGRLVEADALQSHLIARLEHAPNKDDVRIAEELNDLAGIKVAEDELDEAGDLAQQALELVQSSPEPDPLHVAGSLDLLARVQLAQGNIDAAADLAEQALNQLINDAELDDHAVMAGVLVTLGSVQYAKGETEKSAQALEHALKMHASANGPDHPAGKHLAARYGAQASDDPGSAPPAGVSKTASTKKKSKDSAK